MSGHVHDLAALFQQASHDQVQDLELQLIGHVIEYDPRTNMCRVLLPSRRAEDEEGEGENQPMETGWIQVGTGMTGDRFGDQYALIGGATAEEPERGEQVQVSMQHRLSGLCAVANLTFNDEMPPPGGGAEGGEDEGDDEPTAENDPEGEAVLRPGERIIKDQNGTMIKWYANGDLGIRVANNIVINIFNDCTVNVQEGDVELNIEDGDMTVNMDDGDLEVNLEHGDATLNLTQGDAITYTEQGDILAVTDEGDIDIETGDGEIGITATETVDVTSPVVNIVSPVINAGTGVFQQLANALHVIETYNTHTHPFGGPPEPQGVLGVDTTIDLEAS